MKNKVIKEMFDKKINKNRIYYKVIQSNYKKSNIILKYAFCPLVIILFALYLYFSKDTIYYNNTNISLDNYKIGLTYKNMEIQSKEINEITKNIDISSEYIKVENEKNTIYYSKKDNDKLIIITLFEDDYNNNYKISKINNKEVLLYEDGNKLKSIVNIDNTKISIETQKITKQEFIKIIKSIIK